MRGKFGKSVCKCPRCVGRRRIRFLTFSGFCIATAVVCYLLVNYSESAASLSTLEEPALNFALPRQNFEPGWRKLREAATSSIKQVPESTAENPLGDGFST